MADAVTTTTTTPSGAGGSVQATTTVAPSASTAGSTTTPAPPTASSSATSTPSPAPGAKQEWASGLSEKARGLVETKGWANMDAVLDSYSNLEKHLGVDPNQIARIDKMGDPAYRKEVFGKMGAPTNPEGYGLTTEAGGDENFTKGVAKVFHDATLTKDQANAVREGWNNLLKGLNATREAGAQTAHQKGLQDLQGEWQTNYDLNIARAEQAGRALGLKEGALLDPKFSLSGKDLIKLMSTIGEGMGEAKFHIGANPGAGMSKASAIQQRDALFKDRDWVRRYESGGKPEQDQMWAITQAMNT